MDWTSSFKPLDKGGKGKVPTLFTGEHFIDCLVVASALEKKERDSRTGLNFLLPLLTISFK